MTTLRTVHENGVDIRLVGDRWRITSGPPDLSFPSLLAARAAVAPLRPILLFSGPAGERDRSSLMRPNDFGFFNWTALEETGHDVRTVRHIYQLEYLLDAIQYHCTNLARLYASITAEFCEGTYPPGFGSNGVAILAHRTEPYFEFDALIGCAKRTYESLRYLIWYHFGGPGSVPRSLEATLSAQQRVPESLRERLSASWRQFGAPLTAYRDCIHHYVTVDFGMASALMRRLPIGAWGVTMRIPDNPEVRSQKRFTFQLDRDALTYGWEVAFEVLDVAAAVCRAPQRSGAGP